MTAHSHPTPEFVSAYEAVQPIVEAWAGDYQLDWDSLEARTFPLLETVHCPDCGLLLGYDLLPEGDEAVEMAAIAEWVEEYDGWKTLSE